MDIIEMLG